RYHPLCVLGPRLLAENPYARQPLEQLGVLACDPALRIDELVQPLQLGNAERSLKVRHSVVEPDDIMKIASARRHPVIAKKAQLPVEIGVVGDDHSALAGRDDLVAVETEYRRLPEASNLLSPIFGAVGLRGILDDPQTTLSSNLGDRAEIHRV